MLKIIELLFQRNKKHNINVPISNKIIDHKNLLALLDKYAKIELKTNIPLKEMVLNDRGVWHKRI